MFKDWNRSEVVAVALAAIGVVASTVFFTVDFVSARFEREMADERQHRLLVNEKLEELLQETAYLRGLLEGGAQPADAEPRQEGR